MSVESTMLGRLDAEQLREIKEEAGASGIPWELVAAVIAVESGGRWDPEQPAVRFMHRDGELLKYIGLWDVQVKALGFVWEDVRHDRRLQVRVLVRRMQQLRDGFNIWRYILGQMSYSRDLSDRILSYVKAIELDEYREQQEAKFSA